MAVSSREVIALLKEVLETDSVDESSELGRPQQWNSLHHIKFLFAMEKKFGVKVGTEKVAYLNSIRSILEFLNGPGPGR